MKIVAMNGSPRKDWNCSQMLDSFIEGLKSARPDVEVERVHVFDLDFRGCRSCLGCRARGRKETGCVVRDGAYELLRELRRCDGIVFSAPIYYWEIPAHMRALFERLFYPGLADHTVPVTAIYTMNQPKEVADREFAHMMDATKFFFDRMFRTDTDRVCAYQTLQWPDNSVVEIDGAFLAERMKHHEEHWPEDLKNACDAGVRFAAKLPAGKA